MPLDRQKVRLFRSHAEADDGGYMPGTPAERLGEVWELTKEVWSFAEGKDAEQRLQRMLQCLSDEGVKFLVVGAYALAVHGYPRATKDIDFFVWANPENARSLLRALDRYGAALEDLSATDFASEGTVFQIGVGPRRIDIVTRIDGVKFEDAYARRVTVQREGMEFPVISRDDLITNKRASGRAQDLADVERLTERTRSRDDDLTR